MKLISELSQEDRDRLQSYILHWCDIGEQQLNTVDDYLANLGFDLRITPGLGIPIWAYKYNNEEKIEIYISNSDVWKLDFNFAGNDETIFSQEFKSVEDLIKFMETN